MGRHTIFIAALLVVNEIQSQIIFSNINGPSVIENISNVNEKGSSVLTIINGQVVSGHPAKDPEESKPSVVINNESSIVTVDSAAGHKHTPAVEYHKVDVVHSVQGKPQESKTPVVINNESSIVTVDSSAGHKHTPAVEYHKVDVVHSVQGKPQADISAIKGPVVIHGTGSGFTSIQSEPNSDGQMLSVIITNGNTRPHETSPEETLSANDQPKTTTSPFWRPHPTVNKVQSFTSKPSVAHSCDNDISKNFVTSKADVNEDTKIHFPKN